MRGSTHLFRFCKRKRCDADRWITEDQFTLNQIEVEDAQFLAGMGCSFLVSALLFSEMPAPYRGRSSSKEGADGWNPAKREGAGPRGDTSPLCPRSLQGSGVGTGCSAFAATAEGGSLSHMLSWRKRLKYECRAVFSATAARTGKVVCLPSQIWAWKTSGERGPVSLAGTLMGLHCHLAKAARPRGWQCP